MVFTIGKVFHITHVIDDLEAVDRWYDEVFAGQRIYHGYVEAAKRDASLVLIGDAVMEPVAQAKVAGAAESPIGRFRTRFGQHFHSIAWYVDSVDAIFDALRSHGFRCYGVGGNLLSAPPSSLGTTAIFTHPRETVCMLEFSNSPAYRARDPRLAPGWSATFWRDQHPLGIEQTSHLTVLVRDLEKAKTVFQGALGGRVLHEETSTAKGTRSVFFAIGDESVVEAAVPTAEDGLAGRDLAKNGEIFHALTFRVRDLGATAAYFRTKGIPTQELDDQAIILDPAAAFGLVLGFTQRRIPGDPRG